MAGTMTAMHGVGSRNQRIGRLGNYVEIRPTGQLSGYWSLGPDDVGERETAPPYDKPLRGAQVLVRGYELDSRAIRQVRVSQHFMPE